MKLLKSILFRKSDDDAELESRMPNYFDAFEERLALDTEGESEPQPIPRTAKITVLDTAAAPETPETAAPAGAVNIWDIEDENDTPELQAAPTPRRRRNKTRVLGFNPDAPISAGFDEPQHTKTSARSQFPVGWILVEDGPGRGECFALEPGMSQIGRGEDQAIQLDFGDSAISRNNHAAVVYDPETHEFTLGHGGKQNIVRLNGKPVVSNETLTTGDNIKVGETVLRFVPLCTAEFNWSDKGTDEESENVAIA